MGRPYAAVMQHMDTCTHCTLERPCPTGQRLLDAAHKLAAQLMAPIPPIRRHKAKA